ncbi:MAG: hypothetical protein H6566_16240 [Lewinellaceae bacterium]|nr:hypothetical protein [Lewinellaceae bacterium]
MNKHYPLDEAFRKKLRDFAPEPPMHLWEQIEQERNWRHRFLNKARQHQPLVVLGGAILLVGLSWLAWPIQPPVLQSFPVPLSTAVASLAPPEKESVSTLPRLQNTAPPLINQNGSPALASNIIKPIALPGTNTSSEVTAGINAEAFPAEGQMSQEQQTVAFSLPEVRPFRDPLPPVLPTLMEQETEKEPGLLKNLFSPEPKCAEFGHGVWSFYLDALASPDLSIRQMQPRNPEYEEYVQSRRETESNMLAFSGALRLSMVSDKGLAVRTGINYSQINEKFTYFSGSEEIIQYINRYDQDGNVIGTDTLIEVGARHKVTHNQYRMLDIPFLLGYEIGKGRLGVSLNGGAYLNLLFRQKGDFLSPQDLRPVSFDSGNPDAYPAFKQQVGLGWYGSIGFAYRTSGNLQIVLEPHFKIFPKSVTRDQYAVTQRYMSTGLFIGLRQQL